MKAPIGELPSPCPELERRLAELPDDAPLVETLRVISEWERWAVRQFRRMEQTDKSGIIQSAPFM